MTENKFNIETFGNAQSLAYKAENLSELLEQESRRYSRRLMQEYEARMR